MAIDRDSAASSPHPDGCDELQAAGEARLSVDVVRFCTSRGLVSPANNNGVMLYSERDLIILKVISILIGAVTLDRSTQSCRLKWGLPGGTALRWPATFPPDWKNVIQEVLRGDFRTVMEF